MKQKIFQKQPNFIIKLKNKEFIFLRKIFLLVNFWEYLTMSKHAALKGIDNSYNLILPMFHPVGAHELSRDLD